MPNMFIYQLKEYCTQLHSNRGAGTASKLPKVSTYTHDVPPRARLTTHRPLILFKSRPSLVTPAEDRSAWHVSYGLFDMFQTFTQPDHAHCWALQQLCPMDATGIAEL